jgi:hypothetical protein
MLELETFKCSCGEDYNTWRLTAPFQDKSLRGKILNSYMCEKCQKETGELITSEFRRQFVTNGGSWNPNAR